MKMALRNFGAAERRCKVWDDGSKSWIGCPKCWSGCVKAWNGGSKFWNSGSKFWNGGSELTWNDGDSSKICEGDYKTWNV